MSAPVPPCAGRWDIFDSTDLRDHAYAASLCQSCPIIRDCRDLLKAARDESMAGANYGPQGTWAGLPVGETRMRATKARQKAEDAMFTPDEIRAGHNAYQRGNRDEDTKLKERIYQRQRGPRPKKKVAA